MTEFESRQAFIGSLRGTSEADEQSLKGDSIAYDDANHAPPKAF
jgi:hypothetical protein